MGHLVGRHLMRIHCPLLFLLLITLTEDSMKALAENKLNSFLAPRQILNASKEFLSTIAVQYQPLTLKHVYIPTSEASRISSVVIIIN